MTKYHKYLTKYFIFNKLNFIKFNLFLFFSLYNLNTMARSAKQIRRSIKSLKKRISKLSKRKSSRGSRKSKKSSRKSKKGSRKGSRKSKKCPKGFHLSRKYLKGGKLNKNRLCLPKSAKKSEQLSASEKAYYETPEYLEETPNLAALGFRIKKRHSHKKSKKRSHKKASKRSHRSKRRSHKKSKRSKKSRKSSKKSKKSRKSSKKSKKTKRSKKH